MLQGAKEVLAEIEGEEVFHEEAVQEEEQDVIVTTDVATAEVGEEVTADPEELAHEEDLGV